MKQPFKGLSHYAQPLGLARAKAIARDLKIMTLPQIAKIDLGGESGSRAAYGYPSRG